jgi:hypothetical protein
MPKNPFDEAVEHTPEEHKRLLEKMMELGLIISFASNDTTGKTLTTYTPKGLEFIRLVKAVSAPEPSLRLARLFALEALAENAMPV